LAQSLNFDSSAYKSDGKEDTANKNTADSYESVIRNINDLIKTKDENHWNWSIINVTLENYFSALLIKPN
jgi:hypothetical protein